MSGWRERGISMLLVIFLLGSLSAMGLAVARISTTQHFSVAYSARAVQAYLAARAGLDYAAARITSNAGCAGIATPLTVEGMVVTIQCASAGPFDESGASVYQVFDVTATASAGGFSAPDVVNRRVRATVKFP